MSYMVRAEPGFWVAPAWKLLEAGSGSCLYFKAHSNPFAIKTRKGVYRHLVASGEIGVCFKKIEFWF